MFRNSVDFIDHYLIYNITFASKGYVAIYKKMLLKLRLKRNDA